MIDAPLALVHRGLQSAWLDVVRRLANSHWETRNLVVQIQDTGAFDDAFNDQVTGFARAHGLLGPKHVAYTIFPQGLYSDGHDAAYVFRAYNRAGGMYERLHRKTRDWGTYFRRMTQYPGHDGVVNQLGEIIAAIRDRKGFYTAAYTIVIQKPGGETIRPLGGPCLNYVAVQAEPGPPRQLGLLAVYRNHDFLERAYGNYWGLCNLVRFLAKEVGCDPGPLTCVSSHAYVDGKKAALKAFVEGLP
jgi:thymidylate synthase